MILTWASPAAGNLAVLKLSKSYPCA